MILTFLCVPQSSHLVVYSTSIIIWTSHNDQVSQNPHPGYHTPILTLIPLPLSLQNIIGAYPHYLPSITIIHCRFYTLGLSAQFMYITFPPPPFPFAFFGLSLTGQLKGTLLHIPACIYHPTMPQYDTFDRFFMYQEAGCILFRI